MNFKVLQVMSRSVVIEVLDYGIYHTEKEYEVIINDQRYMTSQNTICTIRQLKPDTTYKIQIKVEEKLSDVVEVKTKYEFVTLNVKKFGAVGDGKTDDTTFLQAAIAACPKDGRILIPEGVYCVTSLFLKCDITIHIEKNATILGITDSSKNPIFPGMIESFDETKEYNIGSWEGNPLDNYAGVINGLYVSNVTITGQGTIDGGASHENWWKDPKTKKKAYRPRLVFLNHCLNIVIEGITLCNSPSWTLHPYYSDQLYFYNLYVHNPKISPNTDGLDPESCSHVVICGVHFSLGDDCIAIKSGKIYMGTKYSKPSSDIQIHQCFMENGHGAVTVGSEMAGGVNNISVTKCIFKNTDRGLRVKTRRGRGKNAIVDQIEFDNIRMEKVLTPIVVNCFYNCDPDGHSDYVQTKEMVPFSDQTPTIGTLIFKNIDARDCQSASVYVYGLPENKVKKLILENCRFEFAKECIASQPAMMDDQRAVSRLDIMVENVTEAVYDNVEVIGAEK